MNNIIDFTIITSPGFKDSTSSANELKDTLENAEKSKMAQIIFTPMALI